MFKADVYQALPGQDPRMQSRLIEPSSGTTFRQLMDSRDGRSLLYELIWHDTPLLLLVDHNRGYETSPEAERRLPRTMRITHFGTVPDNPQFHRWLRTYTPPEFATNDEQEAAYFKAVEGLLAYGFNFNGLHRPGHFIVRVYEGPRQGEYTLADFGYAVGNR